MCFSDGYRIHIDRRDTTGRPRNYKIIIVSILLSAAYRLKNTQKK